MLYSGKRRKLFVDDGDFWSSRPRHKLHDKGSDYFLVGRLLLEAAGTLG